MSLKQYGILVFIHPNVSTAETVNGKRNSNSNLGNALQNFQTILNIILKFDVSKLTSKLKKKLQHTYKYIINRRKYNTAVSIM